MMKSLSEKISDMLRERVINSARSLCKYFVSIAIKIHDLLRFRVNYHALNKRVNADKLSVPSFDAVIEHMFNGEVSSNLDMIAKY